jgi:hypothetical protein
VSFFRTAYASQERNSRKCVLYGLYYSAKPWRALAQLTSQVPLSLLTFPKRARPDSGERIPASSWSSLASERLVIAQQYPMETAVRFIGRQNNTDCGEGWSVRRNIEAEILGHPPTAA